MDPMLPASDYAEVTSREERRQEYERLGALLRDRRERLGLTRERVVRLLDITTVGQLYRWEETGQKPDPVMLLKLLSLYALSPGQALRAAAPAFDLEAVWARIDPFDFISDELARSHPDVDAAAAIEMARASTLAAHNGEEFDLFEFAAVLGLDERETTRTVVAMKEAIAAVRASQDAAIRALHEEEAPVVDLGAEADARGAEALADAGEADASRGDAPRASAPRKRGRRAS